MDIHLDRLTKRYRGGTVALSDVTLDLPTGMYGLLGANGAGKTTLMRILAGLLRPTSGTARRLGTELPPGREPGAAVSVHAFCNTSITAPPCGPNSTAGHSPARTSTAKTRV